VFQQPAVQKIRDTVQDKPRQSEEKTFKIEQNRLTERLAEVGSDVKSYR
jgi:hypothetical protein